MIVISLSCSQAKLATVSTNMFPTVRSMRFCPICQGKTIAGSEQSDTSHLIIIIRRARENSGILQKLQKEKMLLRKELQSRVRQGQLLHKPRGDYDPI